MHNLLSKFTLLSKPVLVLATFGLIISLSACSNNNNTDKSKTAQAVKNQQKVELGTVVAVRTIQVKPDAKRPFGNIGVAASSGGFRGVYGSIDIATIGRLFNKSAKVQTAQEVIVKKSSGETVAITQAFKENFKQGDAIKILIRDGKAQVVR